MLGHLHGHLLLGLLGRGAQVRRDHDVVQGQELGAGRRFFLEDVQGGAGDALVLQRLVQCLLVDELAAGQFRIMALGFILAMGSLLIR